jgi:hypothetical protein
MPLFAKAVQQAHTQQPTVAAVHHVLRAPTLVAEQARVQPAVQAQCSL